MSGRAGYVYLLKAHDGLYKIGMTIDPKDRKRTFDVKLPFQVQYEHLIPCRDRYESEKRLHAHFACRRVNGEWFRLTSKDVERIKAVKTL